MRSTYVYFLVVSIILLNALILRANEQCTECAYVESVQVKGLSNLSLELRKGSCSMSEEQTEKSEDGDDFFDIGEEEKNDFSNDVDAKCQCDLLAQEQNSMSEKLVDKSQRDMNVMADKIRTIFYKNAENVLVTSHFLRGFANGEIAQDDVPSCSLKEWTPEKLGCSLELIEENIEKYFGQRFSLDDLRKQLSEEFLNKSKKMNDTCLRDNDIDLNPWDSDQNLESRLIDNIYLLYQNKTLDRVLNFLDNDATFFKIFNDRSVSPLVQVKGLYEMSGYDDIADQLTTNPLFSSLFSSWESMDDFRQFLRSTKGTSERSSDGMERFIAILKNKSLQRKMSMALNDSCSSLQKFSRKLLCAQKNQMLYTTNPIVHKQGGSPDSTGLCLARACSGLIGSVYQEQYDKTCHADKYVFYNVDDVYADLQKITPENLLASSFIDFKNAFSNVRPFQKLCDYKQEKGVNMFTVGSPDSMHKKLERDPEFKILNLIGRNRVSDFENNRVSNSESGEKIKTHRFQNSKKISSEGRVSNEVGKYVLAGQEFHSNMYDMYAHIFDLPEPIKVVVPYERDQRVAHVDASSLSIESGREKKTQMVRSTMTDTHIPTAPRAIQRSSVPTLSAHRTNYTSNEQGYGDIPDSVSVKSSIHVSSPGMLVKQTARVANSLVFGEGVQIGKITDLNQREKRSLYDSLAASLPRRSLLRGEAETNSKAFHSGNDIYSYVHNKNSATRITSSEKRDWESRLRELTGKIGQGDLITAEGGVNKAAFVSSALQGKNTVDERVFEDLLSQIRNGELNTTSTKHFASKTGINPNEAFIVNENGVPVLYAPQIDSSGIITGFDKMASIDESVYKDLLNKYREIINSDRNDIARHIDMIKLVYRETDVAFPPIHRENGLEFLFFGGDVGPRPVVYVKSEDKICRFFMEPVQLDQNQGMDLPRINMIQKMLMRPDLQAKLEKKWREHFR